MNRSLNNDDVRGWFLRLLMRRSCTSQEARQRLGEREVDESVAETLIAEAQEMGFLDDSAYARLFAESHTGWGNKRIVFELGRRGVSEENIEAGLENTAHEEERLRPLVSSWRKSGLEERKIITRLCRRGFSGRSIRAVCQSQDDDVFD
ncbi:MAG: recombination regulator RecX [Fretibacterium sp.]|nr:recombination regulator RecX [Fretibacterium sp.]